MKKTKLRDIEKDYGVEFNCHKNTNLSTFLRKNGLSSMAKFVDKLDKRKTK